MVQNTWDLLLLSLQPVGEVLLLCGVGAWLAHPRVNLFPAGARDYVNQLVFYVFLPALVFAQLGDAVTLKKIIRWWYMPVNVLLVAALGAAVGVAVVRLCRPPKKFHRLTIACCSVGNIGNLPLVLMYGVCSDTENPFGEEGDCRDQGVAYITYGMWMATFLMWTLIYNYLRPSDGALPLESGSLPTVDLSQSASITSTNANGKDGFLSTNQEPAGVRLVMPRNGEQIVPDVGQRDGCQVSVSDQAAYLGRTQSEKKQLNDVKEADSVPLLVTAKGVDRQVSSKGVTGHVENSQSEELDRVSFPVKEVDRQLSNDNATAEVEFSRLEEAMSRHNEKGGDIAAVSLKGDDRQLSIGPKPHGLPAQQASHHFTNMGQIDGSTVPASTNKESRSGAGKGCDSDLRVQIPKGDLKAAVWENDRNGEYDRLDIKWSPQPLFRESHPDGSNPLGWATAHMCERLQRLAARVQWRDVFTPPTSAAAVALGVGAVPALKAIFFGPEAPLQLVTHTLDLLGTAMIPCMMLVLGGNLSQGPGETAMGLPTLVGISLTRLLLVPLAGFAIIPLVDFLGWLPPADPMFRFVLLLQYGVPTAINIGTVAQLHRVGEREVSVVLFWEYLLCGLPLTAFIMAAFAFLF